MRSICSVGQRATVVLLASLTILAVGCTGSGSGGSAGDTTAATFPEMQAYERPTGPSPGCESPNPDLATTTEGVVDHEGSDRSYNLFVPPGVADEPLPLVVNLHGATGTDDGQDATSELPELAVEEQFVLLSPQAADPGRSWQIQPGGDDVSFVLGLIDEVEAGVCIDLARVYVTGFSMGAMLATTLSCIEPGRFAGVAPVAGLADVPACADAERRRAPLISFHGTEDDAIYADGTYAGPVKVVSGLDDGPTREELAAEWAEALDCDLPPEVIDRPPVSTTTYSCADGFGVEFHLIEGADHHWPGGDPGMSRPEAPAGEPESSRLIWDFFERHQPTDGA